ncbi:MAG TPA: methyltransferase domain-containing protein [Streptosporangiaceae bacterium]|jgi:2-polyprenyl-3-methyl-5-hydroxy-6-metoxy-1,4-benzoquinol methylase|nr:methyltransferase domain-containing protein [Streptosporangiaceae bacterium]
MSLSSAEKHIESGITLEAENLLGGDAGIQHLVDISLLPDGAGEQGTIRAAHRWYEHLIALWAPGVIEAAHDLGMFRVLAEGPLTSAEVAAACGTDMRATRVLLDALYAYELIDRTSGLDDTAIYIFPEDAHGCLLPGGIYSLSGKIAYDRSLAWAAWRGLTQAVRTGSHTENGSDRLNQISEAEYEQLVQGINFWAPPVVSILAEALERQGWSAAKKPYRMLDVGCGTGLYGQLLARRISSVSVTGIDVERILSIANAQAESLGVEDRFLGVALDFQNECWGEGFDLVFLANIFHLQTPDSASQLARKAAAAIAPDGIVAIADHIIVDDFRGQSTQDRFFRLFAASMLASGGGDAYRLQDYDTWLAAAGLKRIALFDAPMHRILLATPVTSSSNYS